MSNHLKVCGSIFFLFWPQPRFWSPPHFFFTCFFWQITSKSGSFFPFLAAANVLGSSALFFSFLGFHSLKCFRSQIGFFTSGTERDIYVLPSCLCSAWLGVERGFLRLDVAHESMLQLLFSQNISVSLVFNFIGLTLRNYR